MTNTTNTQELANKLQKLVHSYDSFTMYIDNYKQMKQAEESNDRISKEFVDTCAEYGIHAHINDCGFLSSKTGTVYSKQTVEEAVAEYISNFIKEDVAMNETVNATTIKEEETMKKRTIAIVDVETQECVETTLDALSLEELIDMKELTKDIIRAYLEEEGVVISNTEFKKTKRAVLIQSLYNVMHPVVQEVAQETKNVSMVTTAACKCTRCGGSGIFYTRVENNIPIKAIPDNGMCYRCQGTGIEPEKKTSSVTPATVPVGDFSSDTAPVFDDETTKMSALRKLIVNYAKANQKNGYGFSVSAYMLCAYILQVYCGIEKLKGANITKEQENTCKRVREELKSKGYVIADLYEAVNDNTKKVRLYTNHYTGRKESSHGIVFYPCSNDPTLRNNFEPNWNKPTSYFVNESIWK